MTPSAEDLVGQRASIALRILLGAALAMSGAAKVLSPPDARSAFGRLHETAGGALALALSIGEIAAGVWIAVRPHPAAFYAVSAISVGAALGMLIAHLAFNGQALPCGCLGRAPIGPAGRAALLAAVAVSSTTLALEARTLRRNRR